MSPKVKNVLRAAAVPVLLLVAGAVPAAAQQPIKIAVVDAERVIMESTRGKAALEVLKKLSDEKSAEARRLQAELTELERRIKEGGNALAEATLLELQSQFEDKVIAYRRFEDDAKRQIQAARDSALAGIERDAMVVVDAIAKEQGYTLVFNKFRSGLVFATDEVDITAAVVQRFDAAPASGG
jgi:Skp family chaperone for outer membrane proteins